MPRKTMREIRAGEVPYDGGTAVQDDPDRPVFRGNGADDYVCVECGNVLAVGMDAEHMTKRVRIRCGRCRTVNVSAEVPVEMSRRPTRPTNGR
jgi:DNA-directed RNA polymerase subunit RPC12/RpoP